MFTTTTKLCQERADYPHGLGAPLPTGIFPLCINLPLFCFVPPDRYPRVKSILFHSSPDYDVKLKQLLITS